MSHSALSTTTTTATIPSLIPLQSLLGKPLEELKAWFLSQKLSSAQAIVLFRALHRRYLLEVKQIEGLGSRAQRVLEKLPSQALLSLAYQHHSQDGTLKLGWRLASGALIESVLIFAPKGRITVCLSSQVGCAVACPFCATGRMGWKANLRADEILAQYHESCRFSPTPVRNVVFMGMGEPLQNEKEVLKACKIFTEDQGLGLAKRKITISTSGIVPKIPEVWNANTAALAISLHATTDELRNTLVPLNKKWNLALLQQTLKGLQYRGHDHIMVEYLLLGGINDTPEDAYRLAKWCQAFPCKVNLLPFNAFPSSSYQPAPPEKVLQFQEILHQNGVFQTFRYSCGEDILAACGQLATAVKTSSSHQSLPKSSSSSNKAPFSGE
jgi:adenine C2-methylase RlmN of 23S rRNA A2503 and tRNA A37